MHFGPNGNNICHKEFSLKFPLKWSILIRFYYMYFFKYFISKVNLAESLPFSNVLPKVCSVVGRFSTMISSPLRIISENFIITLCSPHNFTCKTGFRKRWKMECFKTILIFTWPYPSWFNGMVFAGYYLRFNYSNLSLYFMERK